LGEAKERLSEILSELKDVGIENVLALRGDPPRGETEWKPHPGGLHYSVELIEVMARDFDFCIGAACFPEVHPDAPNLQEDLKYARRKVEAGASFLITQLFFDNELYFDFVDEARAAGITVRSSRASCRSPASSRSRRSPRCARPRSRPISSAH